MRRERVENVAKRALCLVQKTVVVQRPPTAQRSRRNQHAAAGRLERLGRGDGRVGMKVVVEGIRPQQHGWPSIVGLTPRSFARTKPGDERAGCKSRNGAPLRNAGTEERRGGKGGGVRW